MSWATGIMVYLVIWWTILFTVLPLGVRRVENPGKGEERGARSGHSSSARRSSPRSSPRVLWIGFYFLHQSDVFSFRRMVE